MVKKHWENAGFVKRAVAVCGIIIVLGGATAVIASWLSRPADYYIIESVKSTGLPDSVLALSNKLARLHQDSIDRDTKLREDFNAAVSRMEVSQAKIETKINMIYDQVKQK